jgi:hypothetical protein
MFEIEVCHLLSLFPPYYYRIDGSRLFFFSLTENLKVCHFTLKLALLSCPLVLHAILRFGE